MLGTLEAQADLTSPDAFPKLNSSLQLYLESLPTIESQGLVQPHLRTGWAAQLLTMPNLDAHPMKGCRMLQVGWGYIGGTIGGIARMAFVSVPAPNFPHKYVVSTPQFSSTNMKTAPVETDHFGNPQGDVCQRS